MRRRIILTALFALTLIVTQAVIARQDDDRDEDSATLHLGFVGYLLSGPEYDFGSVSGAQLAVEQINRAGGVTAPDGVTYTLELDIESAINADEARAAMRRLFEVRGVIALLGPDAVDQILPNLDLAAGFKVPQLTSASAAALTAQDASNYVFRVRASDLARARALADYLVNQVGFRRIATSFTNTTYGNAGVVTFDSALGDLGVQPVIEAQHDPSDLDMTVAAQVIASNAPEVVVHWGNSYQAAMLLQQLRNLGWQGSFVHSDIDATFRGLLNPDHVDGVLGVLSWSYTLPEPASRVFLADYVQAFGVTPTARSAAYYDAVQLVADAVRAVGTDPTEVRNYLLNRPPFEGVQGVLDPAAYQNGETGTNTVIIAIDRDIPIPRARARYRDGGCVAGCAGAPALAMVPTVAPTPPDTATPTVTLTPSETPTITLTPTETPTIEFASLPTETPTVPTATDTPTPTDTPALTFTPTATLPVSASLTPTATQTPAEPTAAFTFTPTGVPASPTATQTEEPTPEPTVTLTPTPTRTPGPVYVQTGDVRMNLRAGPSDVSYRVVHVLPERTTIRVIGRNADTTWLFVEYERDGETSEAWIAGWLVEPIEGDPELLPVLAPWGATPTPGPTPASVPIVALLYDFDSEEAMDMMGLLLQLEQEYGNRGRFVYINVNDITDYALYNRIYEGMVPALGFIDRNNVLRQVITGTVAETDLRILLENLLAVDF